MTVSLRPAQQDDQATIRHIIRQARINPTGLDWRHFLVAEDGGQIVGIGQIKPHRDGSRELASLAVIPARQRQGIATRIIRALLVDEPPPVHLMCQRELAPFYRRYGFHALHPAEMPPYFRRVAWLMNLFSAAQTPRLAVMRWDG